MTKHIFGTLLALALATSACAHGWDGKTVGVALSGEDGAANATDTWTFANGTLSSEWLAREGFAPAAYRSDDDDFEANFTKGEDRVHVRGELEDGKLEGHVKWTRHHEGGHKKWEFVESAVAPAPAPAPAAEGKH